MLNQYVRLSQYQSVKANMRKWRENFGRRAGPDVECLAFLAAGKTLIWEMFVCLPKAAIQEHIVACPGYNKYV